MPHDPDGQREMVAKARAQLADHIRAGASVIELTKEQAWKNTLGKEAEVSAQDNAGEPPAET